MKQFDPITGPWPEDPKWHYAYRNHHDRFVFEGLTITSRLLDRYYDEF